MVQPIVGHVPFFNKKQAAEGADEMNRKTFGQLPPFEQQNILNLGQIGKGLVNKKSCAQPKSAQLQMPDMRLHHQKSFIGVGNRASSSLSYGNQPTLKKQQSKVQQIKEERRDKMFKERLIRQFNYKMFDKVVNELRQQAQQESLNQQVPEHDQEDVEDIEVDGMIDQEALNQEEEEVRSAKLLGKFLYETKGLDKQMIGYYFGEAKKFNQLACKEFLRCLNFKNLPIDSCWRLIFNKTDLPKEGQQIVRIMTIFQDVYLEKNPDKGKWEEDTVWLFSVKLLDLNTNLHNPNVIAMLRYTKETFVQ